VSVMPRRSAGGGVLRREIPVSLPFDASAGAFTPTLDGIVRGMGAGAPLTHAERARYPRESAPVLDTVRVHSRPQDSLSADLLGSEAFTFGNHIVVGNTGANSTSRHERVLAHEVAHAIQQSPLMDRGGTRSPAGSERAEREADQFADAAFHQDRLATSDRLTPTDVGLARKVVWKYIQPLAEDLLLIIDVDDGDFVGGCVSAIVPHIGIKLIKKTPHAQLLNVHVGVIRNPKGEWCVFFYESVSKICEMMCFPTLEELKKRLKEIIKWILDLLQRIITVLAILVLIAVAAVLLYLLAEGLAIAFAALLLVLA
jgi:Domain of unknown function (DUF4157)